MTENIQPVTEPARDVEVTYTQEHKVTVKVPDRLFMASLGPMAKADAFGPRVDSLMAGYVQKAIDRSDPAFDGVPDTATVVRVDVK